jgi:thiol-disulfide isomerase/thioredoxin/uncharacterized membrane protein YphA (DoxX/SURF4 family)
MEILLLVTRLILCGVFLVAAVSKLADKSRSREMLVDFGVPTGLAQILAVALPIVELIVAIALIPLAIAWFGAVGAIALLAAFIIGIAANLALGRRPKCNCFGQFHSAPIGWWVLGRNGVLVALATAIVWRGKDNVGPSVLGWLSDLTVAQRVGVLGGVIGLSLLSAEAALLLQILRQQGRILLRLDALEGISGKSGLDGSFKTVGAPPRAGLPVGALAPRFVLKGLDEKALTLEDLMAVGKPIFLVFTNPNCGPCQALLPEVASWQSNLGGRLMIALITEGSKEDNRAKVSSLGTHVSLLLQQKREVAESFLAYGTPGAVLVLTNGTIGSPLAQGANEIRALVAQIAADERATTPREPLAVNQAVQRPGGAAAPKPPKQVLGLGTKAPALTFEDLDGKKVSLATFRGSETLVLFWNPACGYCQQMLRDLQSWEAARPLGAPELLVISTGTQEVNRAMRLRSPVVLDESFSAGSAFGANGTPSAILLDAKGRVASRIAVGAQAVFSLANSDLREGFSAPLEPFS